MTSRSQRWTSPFLGLETGSGWRLPSLDGLRGIAAAMVVVSHAHDLVVTDRGPWTPWIAWAGQGGVMLFFALSGFLLYLPFIRGDHEGRPLRFRTYAARRCLRIMPAYYVCAAGLAAAAVIRGETVGLRDIVAHLAFLPLFARIQLQSVFWSLQVEEFFYWAMPPLHRLFRRSAALVVVGCVVLSAGWAGLVFVLVPEEWQHAALTQTPFYLLAFALGMLSAARWVADRSARGATWLVVLGAAGYLLVAQLASAWSLDETLVATPFVNLAMAPFFSALVLGVARGGAAFLAATPLRLVGSVSYSLYLWHHVVLRGLIGLVPRNWSVVELAVVGGALSLIAATAGYLAVERPFLMLRPHAGAPRA